MEQNIIERRKWLDVNQMELKQWKNVISLGFVLIKSYKFVD